jgi:hypothetical protein
MPGALLVRLRAGLRKKKKGKLESMRQGKTQAKGKEGKTGSLPAGYRHLAAVALRAEGLAATILLGALGGRNLAGARLRGWSLIFETPGGQVVLASFALKRGRALHDLGVGVG